MKYDITVVGAGPAGSTAAKFLSEKGFKVLMIDKEKFPREKNSIYLVISLFDDIIFLC